MSSRTKNLIIILVIVFILFVLYFLYIKPSNTTPAPLLSSVGPVSTNTNTNMGINSSDDFLALLLNVKSIKLNDSIFSDNVFTSLHDSSITLTPDGDEGRPNPFAPASASNSNINTNLQNNNSSLPPLTSISSTPDVTTIPVIAIPPSTPTPTATVTIPSPSNAVNNKLSPKMN